LPQAAIGLEEDDAGKPGRDSIKNRKIVKNMEKLHIFIEIDEKYGIMRA
jgi:hypothetical protein